MFSINFKRVYFICDNMIIRTLRNKRLGPNPGLDERTRAFQQEGINFDEDIEEVVENSEGNFFEVIFTLKLKKGNNTSKILINILSKILCLYVIYISLNPCYNSSLKY